MSVYLRIVRVKMQSQRKLDKITIGVQNRARCNCPKKIYSVDLATLFCIEYLPVILSHLQKLRSISIKFYSVNARFYFQGPALYMGSTYRSNHNVLHRIATSYTESSPTNFSQF